MVIVYDGRTSAECRTTCQAGECRHPRTVDGCGGCCGCLGGCVAGYEEQCAEDVMAIELDVRHERTADAADRGGDQ